MILDGTRDWPFLVIHRVTKIHMIYPFIARRIFEVAILQAHKIVHPYLLLSSFLVSSSLSRRFVRGTRKMAGESVYSFPWRKKKKRERKCYLGVSMVCKNFKICDKHLILFLQKETIYFVP